MKIAPILQSLQAKVQSTVQSTAGVPSRIVERADQVLLGLSHSGSALLEQTLNRIEANPNDIVGRVGRTVLARADEIRNEIREEVRRQLGDTRWVPEWLEDVKFLRRENVAAPLAANVAPVVKAAAGKSGKSKRSGKSIGKSAKTKKSATTKSKTAKRNTVAK